MSGIAVPPDDLPMMQYEASKRTLEGGQALVDPHGAEVGARCGLVVRYVIVTESIVDDETRRVDVSAKGPDGSGLYYWETMGLLGHALESARQRV
jgi:hypothetical protein